jgi:hypothetical protein
MSGSLYIENLILVAGIAGISTDLLLIELEEEKRDDVSTSSLVLTAEISVLLFGNSTMEDETMAITIKKYSINLNLI